MIGSVQRGVDAWVALLLLAATACGQRAAEAPPGGDDALPTAPLPGATDLDSLLKKDIGELSRTPVVVAPALAEHVSTVNRTESTVGKSAAAVFVITNEMIRRSGATNVMDALRMAPGVQVARVDAARYAISIRGFNQEFANKLLVLVDGREVYSQFFAGTYWDAQIVPLEDVDRIEVIRGPGATMWGCNAVNGVISIITKSAKQTQGLMVQGGAGDQERGFGTARYGGKAGENLYWRAYGTGFDRAPGYSANPTNDAWRAGQGGFRLDWEADACNTMTFLGNFQGGGDGIMQTFPVPTFPFQATSPININYSGANWLYRWDRRMDDETGWTFQTYFDQTVRYMRWVDEVRNVYDVDFVYRFPLGDCQQFVCGAGYQSNADDIRTSAFGMSINDPQRQTNRFSYFVQDQITLRDDLLFLTLGSKFVHNSFTPFEFQPSVRMLWTPTQRQAGWAAVSRAVRLPSRAENDMTMLGPPIAPGIPVFPQLTGTRNLTSEQLLAWEIGWREQPTEQFSWDIALFYNNYYDRITNTVGMPFPSPPGMIVPLLNVNGLSNEAYGGEIFANCKVTDRWRLYGSYSLLYIFAHPYQGANPAGDGGEGTSPVNTVYAQSSWDLRRNLQFDLIGRYVDALPALNVPSYVTMDARLGWRPNKHWELAIVGQNLLDNHYLQFNQEAGAGIQATEVRRGFYGMATVWY